MNDVMPYITLFCQWRQRRNDDAQTLLPLPPFLGVWYQEPAREPRGVGPLALHIDALKNDGDMWLSQVEIWSQKHRVHRGKSRLR